MRHEYGLEAAGTPDDLDRMLPQCDFLSLHLHSERKHAPDHRSPPSGADEARGVSDQRGARGAGG